MMEMKTQTKYTLKHLLKSLKKHERVALLPLYREHSRYLLRIIKTADISKDILIHIEQYVKFATCHEIAINSMSGFNLITHENPMGLEYEYTTHKEAKNVSRDLRVRIIWRLIEKELINNPNLDNFDIYDIDEFEEDLEYIYCPVCDEMVGTVDANCYFETIANNCNCLQYNDMTGRFSFLDYNTLSLNIDKFLKLHGERTDSVFFEDIVFITPRGEEILEYLYKRHKIKTTEFFRDFYNSAFYRTLLKDKYSNYSKD